MVTVNLFWKWRNQVTDKLFSEHKIAQLVNGNSAFNSISFWLQTTRYYLLQNYLFFFNWSCQPITILINQTDEGLTFSCGHFFILSGFPTLWVLSSLRISEWVLLNVTILWGSWRLNPLLGNSLAVQWLGLHAFPAEGGWTKIPHKKM